jgi:hypothetical protein
MIAEKRKLFFAFLIAQWAQRTSHRLLDGNFHVGGPDHHVAGSIQDDALPGPLVQEQHLALTRHHILASQDWLQSLIHSFIYLQGHPRVGYV